jgi:hypothetical protein
MTGVHPDVEALIAAAKAAGGLPFEAMPPLEARAAYAARRENLQVPAEDVSERRDFAVRAQPAP